MMKYLVKDASMSGFKLDISDELMVFLLLDGQNWRAHDKQAFHYDSGCWDMCDGFANETLELPEQSKDYLLALEGLFIALSQMQEMKEVQWSWSNMEPHVKSLLTKAKTSGFKSMGQLH